MGIRIEDLPPGAREQATRKYQEQMKKAAPKEKKPSKFFNEERDVGRLRFQSKKEAGRYEELMLLQKGGKIRNLRLQADFTLREAYTTTEGVRERAIRYRADFVYEQLSEFSALGNAYWLRIVEDVKSPPTRAKRDYVIKRKLMKDVFNATIREV